MNTGVVRENLYCCNIVDPIVRFNYKNNIITLSVTFKDNVMFISSSRVLMLTSSFSSLSLVLFSFWTITTQKQESKELHDPHHELTNLTIGEKKPEKISSKFFFRLLFSNCINWWAHGEDRGIACFSLPYKNNSCSFPLMAFTVEGTELGEQQQK